MLFFMMMQLACGDNKSETELLSDTSIDIEEDIEDNILDTMEEYISAYCSEYSMRCGGVYESQEECEVSIAAMWGDKVCLVTDTDLLQECINWLSDFPCEDTGWTDECDNFYVCD